MSSEERRYRDLFKILPCRSKIVTVSTITFRPTAKRAGKTYTEIYIPSGICLVPSPMVAPQPGRNTKRSLQFFGVHTCLILTIQRPPIVDNIMRVSETIPEFPTLGHVTWLSHINICCHRVGVDGVPAWRIRIPSTLWSPPPTLVGARRGHMAMLLTKIQSAVSDVEFEVALFPALARKFFDRPLL